MILRGVEAIEYAQENGLRLHREYVGDGVATRGLPPEGARDLNRTDLLWVATTETTDGMYALARFILRRATGYESDEFENMRRFEVPQIYEREIIQLAESYNLPIERATYRSYVFPVWPLDALMREPPELNYYAGFTGSTGQTFPSHMEFSADAWALPPQWRFQFALNELLPEGELSALIVDVGGDASSDPWGAHWWLLSALSYNADYVSRAREEQRRGVKNYHFPGAGVIALGPLEPRIREPERQGSPNTRLYPIVIVMNWQEETRGNDPESIRRRGVGEDSFESVYLVWDEDSHSFIAHRSVTTQGLDWLVQLLKPIPHLAGEGFTGDATRYITRSRQVARREPRGLVYQWEAETGHAIDIEYVFTVEVEPEGGVAMAGVPLNNPLLTLPHSKGFTTHDPRARESDGFAGGMQTLVDALISIV